MMKNIFQKLFPPAPLKSFQFQWLRQMPCGDISFGIPESHTIKAPDLDTAQRIFQDEQPKAREALCVYFA